MAFNKKHVMIDDVQVEYNAPEKKAILLIIKGEKVWMPKSQIKGESQIGPGSKKGDTGTVTVTEWIANEKGLEARETPEAYEND